MSQVKFLNNPPRQINSQMKLYSFYGSYYSGFTLVFYSIMLSWYRFDKKDDNINSWKYDVIGGIVNFTAILGSIATFVQKYLSRRHLLILGAVIGIIGHIFSIMSFIFKGNNQIFLIPLFIIGRIFEGAVVGIFMTFCLVLIHEYSPYELKLNSMCIYQIALALGICITTFIYPALKKIFPYMCYETIITILYCFSIFVLILKIILLQFIFTQEPPIYLIQNNRQQEAKSIISSIYDQQIASQKFLELKHQATIEEGSFLHYFNVKSISRKGLFLGFYVIAIKQMSGLNFITAIRPYQFKNPLCYEEIIINTAPRICQVAGSIFLLIVSNISAFKKLIFYGKRKSLIQFGCIFSCIFMTAILVIQILIKNGVIDQQTYGKWYWTAECPFLFMYGFALGPIIWLNMCQMLKSKHLQLSITFYWILAFFNMNVFIFIHKHSKYFGFAPSLYLIFSLSFVIMNKWYLIETKNKSYLQIVRKIDQFRYCPCRKY